MNETIASGRLVKSLTFKVAKSFEIFFGLINTFCFPDNIPREKFGVATDVGN